MAKALLTPDAFADFKKIGKHTNRQWGRAQRKRYLAHLKKKISQLAKTPSLGRTRDDLFTNLRSSRCGQHTIFYRKNPDGIEVIRILHNAMDFQRHLR